MKERITLNGQDISIRVVTPKDTPALLDVYAPYIIKTAVTFEYEVPSAEEFADRVVRTLVRYPYLAAEDDTGILGYVYGGPLHVRPAYDWSAETSIYVRMDQRGRGIGSALYGALERILLRQGIVNVAACIAYPEEEDEYLTKGSVHFMKRRVTGWWDSFTSVLINSGGGIIWSGWRSRLGRIFRRCLR